MPSFKKLLFKLFSYKSWGRLLMMSIELKINEKD